MSRSATTDVSVGAARGAFAAILVLGLALALLLLVRARPNAEPFDPRSSAATGTTALVELLERSGGTIDITRAAPAPGESTRVLVLLDRLDDDQRQSLFDFIEAGGVAIAADPASTLHGGPDLDGGSVTVSGGNLQEDRRSVEGESNLRPGTCNVAALSPLRGLFVPEGLLYPVGPTEAQCFGRSGQSFVIVRSIGSGTVVGLGDNEVFTNRYLRRSDNAGLATALLLPDGGTNVSILLGTGTNQTVADVGTGEDTLVDLVPISVWMALTLAGLGFVAFAISRSVRAGKVFDEPLVTPIAGSELVVATGNLMQRARHSSRAGWLLQTQFHRDLCAHLGVDPNAPLDEIDRIASSRLGFASGAVETALRSTVNDERELLSLSTRLERLRKDVPT